MAGGYFPPRGGGSNLKKKPGLRTTALFPPQTLDHAIWVHATCTTRFKTNPYRSPHRGIDAKILKPQNLRKPIIRWKRHERNPAGWGCFNPRKRSETEALVFIGGIFRIGAFLRCATLIFPGGGGSSPAESQPAAFFSAPSPDEAHQNFVLESSEKMWLPVWPFQSNSAHELCWTTGRYNFKNLRGQPAAIFWPPLPHQTPRDFLSCF